MSISKLQKLIDKELLVIKDDYFGLIIPESLVKIFKKDMDENEIDAKYSGWNFISNSERYALEGVDIFALTEIK